MSPKILVVLDNSPTDQAMIPHIARTVTKVWHRATGPVLLGNAMAREE